ncbi:DNA-directed RNA polymerase subunit alpha C-terminal domain-containing protein [Actinomadura litoris]|uniref:DNA-directed RNA polymerase subunit alpha C-terminal domain-containing protein n=1 Tax=Actinomadura litoris TaxID=2678616 RepID=UPI001FA74889|nr:DNA-directed RNA polymerase subunit alpha C-terminal domain-containing protein [Actinomadura litoris]
MPTTTTTLQLGDPIALLLLTPRAYNALWREGIHTIGDLTAREPDELTDIRRFGPLSLADVQAKLAAHGLALKNGAGQA